VSVRTRSGSEGVVDSTRAPSVVSLKFAKQTKADRSIPCSSVPEGRNVYRIRNPKALKAPEERNVLLIGGTLRSSGAERTFSGFCFYKHFVPLGLRIGALIYCANFRDATLVML
jgi:hypothetical protein